MRESGNVPNTVTITVRSKRVKYIVYACFVGEAYFTRTRIFHFTTDQNYKKFLAVFPECYFSTRSA